ncbi:MAG TPA: hypothetical protein VLB27_01740, partial [candidate division Zixibacteria bacterium]|nr:hypothetical protein [candidate division Zixibacteria bacterium]
MSPRPVQKEIRGRLARLAAAAVIGALAIGLVRLQVLRHAELLIQSENNRLRVQPLIPRRGHIFDRNGEIIVDNRPSYAVSIVRSELVQDETIPQLSELIDLDSAQIMKRLRNNREPVYLPAVIKRDVEFDKIAILEEQSSQYPGITYNMERVRRYNTELAAESFTGYVG